MFQKEIAVRFSECDGLGHVNNVTYFTYMEDARTEVFRLFNPTLALNSWNLIVASTRCDFLAQVKYAEHLTVFTWIGHIGNSSFAVEHAMQNANGDWVARGQATMLRYDYETQRPANLSVDERDKLSEHMTSPVGAPALR